MACFCLISGKTLNVFIGACLLTPFAAGVRGGHKESKASQERWAHLGKMAPRESKECKVTRERKEIRVSQVRGASQVRLVTGASRANEDAEDHRVREECLGKRDAPVKEEHQERGAARVREEYRDCRDCKASRYTAHLLSRGGQEVSA